MGKATWLNKIEKYTKTHNSYRVDINIDIDKIYRLNRPSTPKQFLEFL